MPPIPGNAPTEGLPALVFWSIVSFAILMAVIIKMLPSGKERAEAQARRDKQKAEAESNSVVILQRQISDIKAEHAAQMAEVRDELKSMRREMRRSAKLEEWNREYRHAIKNQLNALLGWAETVCMLIEDMFLAWEACPPHYKRQYAILKKPAAIMAAYPLPEERHVTDAELDEGD